MGMSDDIVIGDCETSGSAIVIESQRSGLHSPPLGTKTCKSAISESGRSFWVTSAFLDMRMRIAYKTPEGEKLKALLKAKDWDGIDDMLANIALGHASVELIRTKVSETERESYDRGYEDRAKEIRSALGLSRGY